MTLVFACGLSSDDLFAPLPDFENRHMSGIVCGMKVDETGRRTTAIVEFNAAPEQCRRATTVAPGAVLCATTRYGKAEESAAMSLKLRVWRRVWVPPGAWTHIGKRGVTLVIISGLALSVSANAQSFSQRTVDTAILPDLIPGENSGLEPGALSARACEPVAALLQSIRPAPAGDRAVISTADVLQLRGAHKIRDVVCGMAALIELRYHREPCWLTNKC